MITDFVKYKFAEFLDLPDETREEYEHIGMLLPSDPWDIPDVLEWEYLTVKEVQSNIHETIDYEQIIWIINEITGIENEKILSKCWIDVFKFLKFVFDSIEKINELEKKLAYEPDSDEINAGIENYNQFGHFATIDRLSGGDPLKYESIGKLQYSIIFAKLVLNKVDQEFSKKYQAIKSKVK